MEVINQPNSAKNTPSRQQETKPARSSMAEMAGVAGYIDKMRFSEAARDDSEEENPEILNATPMTQKRMIREKEVK